MAEKAKTKAKAPAKEKSERKERQLFGYDRDKAKIRFEEGFSAKVNPHREGTRLADHYSRLRSGMTVREALDAGVLLGVLRYFHKNGEIQIAA